MTRTRSTPDGTRSAFDSRFQHYDGYKSPARQDDLFRVFQSGMQYALASIDTDQLADVIRGATDDGANSAEDYALAVKNWLTGKDQS